MCEFSTQNHYEYSFDWKKNRNKKYDERKKCTFPHFTRYICFLNLTKLLIYILHSQIFICLILQWRKQVLGTKAKIMDYPMNAEHYYSKHYIISLKGELTQLTWLKCNMTCVPSMIVGELVVFQDNSINGIKVVRIELLLTATLISSIH